MRPNPPAIMVQFLAWVVAAPRDYGQTMDAWRTSCPRLSVWEDAMADGLVCMESARAKPQSRLAVRLTERGRTLLASTTDPAADHSVPDHAFAQQEVLSAGDISSS
jgi:hypothetical protein